MANDIAAGRFGDGGRLPPETHLAREFGLSRHTLRQSIAALVKSGLLRSVPHVGTFVAPVRVPFTISSKTRFSEAIGNAGLVASKRVLSQRVCAPPPDIAERLRVARRTEVVEIMLLLMANDQPMGTTVLWLPADRFGRIAEMLVMAGSLRRAMGQLGVGNYSRRSAHITSRFSDAAERSRLGLGANSIVMGFEGVSVDEAGEPTHAFDYRFDADRVALVVHL